MVTRRAAGSCGMPDNPVRQLREPVSPTRIVSLADVVDLRLSSVDKKTNPGEQKVHLCNYADVYNHRVIRADMDYMEATATEREIGNCKLEAGDVIITKDSETPDDIGVPAVVCEGVRDLVCGYHLAILRPSKSVLDGEFLHYALSTSKAKRQFQTYANGITRFGLRRHDIERVRILLPPVPEQRKIAAILSSVDEAFEKTQAVIDQVQVVKRGLMHELFTRGLPGRHTRFKQTEIGEIPEDWMAMTLADAAAVVGGGTPSRSRPIYWNGDVPWATPTDVTSLTGRIISETASSITDAGLASSSATLLPPNSLLMTTRATIGACAINRVAMATNQGFQNLVPERRTCVGFLYYLIQYHARRLKRLAAGSTFLEVSKRTVRGFPVHMPSLSEQRKIAAILMSKDDAIEKIQAVMDGLQVVKSGLMSALLAGELRVTPDTRAA